MFADLYVISSTGFCYLTLQIRKQYSGLTWFLLMSYSGNQQIQNLRNIQNARRPKWMWSSYSNVKRRGFVLNFVLCFTVCVCMLFIHYSSFYLLIFILGLPQANLHYSFQIKYLPLYIPLKMSLFLINTKIQKIQKYC